MLQIHWRASEACQNAPDETTYCLLTLSRTHLSLKRSKNPATEGPTYPMHSVRLLLEDQDSPQALSSYLPYLTMICLMGSATDLLHHSDPAVFPDSIV